MRMSEIINEPSNKELAKSLLLEKNCFCFEGGGVLGIAFRFGLGGHQQISRQTHDACQGSVEP